MNLSASVRGSRGIFRNRQAGTETRSGAVMDGGAALLAGEDVEGNGGEEGGAGDVGESEGGAGLDEGSNARPRPPTPLSSPSSRNADFCGSK